MSEVFQKFYDSMETAQLVSRLPSEYAVNTICKRTATLEDLNGLLSLVGHKIKSFKSLRTHINGILDKHTGVEIVSAIPQNTHKILCAWANEDNVDKIKESLSSETSIELVFNLTEKDDYNGMSKIFDRIIGGDFSIGRVRSFMNRVDRNLFDGFFKRLLVEGNALAKSAMLSSNKFAKLELDTQVNLLKEFVSLSDEDCEKASTLSVDFDPIECLELSDRITFLKRHLNNFPKYYKVKAFRKDVSLDDFEKLLNGASASDVDELVNLYKDITENEQPDKEIKDEHGSDEQTDEA